MNGFVVPVGNSVRKLPAVVFVTVTFSTTAPTPVAGSPPAPATGMLLVCCGPNGPLMPPVPSRVSRMRAGVTGVNSPFGIGGLGLHVVDRASAGRSARRPDRAR